MPKLIGHERLTCHPIGSPEVLRSAGGKLSPIEYSCTNISFRERTFQKVILSKSPLPGNSANMATMNAYGWVKHGGAEAMKLLTVLRPTTPGPGEVLIKLKVGPHV